MKIYLLTVVLAACGCFAQKVELDGDANIYASVIASLKELKHRQLSPVKGGNIIQRATSVCYDELGCFDKNGTFKHVKQLPEPPESVNTQFLLYTRKNSHQPQIIDYKKPETVLDSNLNPSHKVTFITHGFGGKNNLTWVWNMKNAFLARGDMNVIVIDWSKGARVPYYIAAAVNSELVGAQAAVLYYYIKDNFGIQEKDLHVIGFSLGAQVAGFVGKRMLELRGTRPGRLTGLDPAGPLFEDYGPEVHLSKDDADFVDVVHTNADLLIYGGVGMSIPVGHVDYYPNGGKRQPGCGSTIKGAFIDMFKGERERTCNHERAVHLFTDSILYPTACTFISYPCSNYSDFELGKCMSCEESACGHMGYEAKGTGIYYLKTKDKKPYCAEVAKLTVKFAKDVKKSYGGIILTLVGPGDDKENITLTQKDEKLVPGAEKHLAITLAHGTKSLEDITVLYQRYNGWFTKGAETFALGSVTIKNSRNEYIFKSCGNNILLKDNEYQSLTKLC